MKYILFITLILLCSCNPWSSYNNFMYLKKGQNIENSLALAGDNFRREIVNLQYKGDQYSIAVYWFLTESESVDSPTNQVSKIAETETISNYMLVFKNNKLLTWGYEYEIKRDPEFSDLGYFIGVYLHY